MPKYTLAQGTKTLDALPDFLDNVEASYNKRAERLPVVLRQGQPGLRRRGRPDLRPQGPGVPAGGAGQGQGGQARGQGPTAGPRRPVDPKATLILRGGHRGPERDHRGDARRPRTRARSTSSSGGPPRSGATPSTPATSSRSRRPRSGSPRPRGATSPGSTPSTTAEKSGQPFAPLWNRLPPPLLREGHKVQTPWLTAFLKDPYPIRPAAQLRMPKFHYGTTPEELAEAGTAMSLSGTSAREEIRGETRDLANYFAAKDGAEFPYQDIPERERAYLDDPREGAQGLPGRRLADHHQGPVRPVPRHRHLQAGRGRPERQRPRPPPGVPPVPPGLPVRVAGPAVPARPLHRHAPEHPAPGAAPLPASPSRSRASPPSRSGPCATRC